MNDPIAISGLAIGSFAGVLFTIKLFRDLKKNKNNPFFKYFFLFFFFFTLNFIVLFLRIPNFLFPPDSIFLAILYILRYATILTSSVYLIRIIFFFLLPKLNPLVIYIPSFLFIAVNLLLLSRTNLYPVLINNVYRWPMPKNLAISMMSFGEIPFLIVAGVFFYEAYREKSIRRRSILLGLSFVIWTLGGSLFSIQNNTLRILGYVLLTTGIIICYLAFLTKPNSKNP